MKKQCKVYFPPFPFSYHLISLFYQGNHMFEVPDGHRMCIIPDEAGLLITLPYFLAYKGFIEVFITQKTSVLKT